MISEVNVGLPRSQGLIAHLSLGKHDLQPLTIGRFSKPVLQTGEAELAGVANEDDAPADSDLIGGFLAGGQDQLAVTIGVFLTDLRQGVVAQQVDRIGLTTISDDPGSLVEANLHLLGDVRRLAGCGVRIHRGILSKKRRSDEIR